MIFKNKKYNNNNIPHWINLKSILIFFSLLLFLNIIISNDDIYHLKANTIKVQPYKAMFDSSNYEINRIVFKGNISYSSTDLMKVISNRPSDRSFVRDIFEMYYIEGKKNIITPKTIINILNNNIDRLEFELRYLEIQRVNIDIESIKNFYNRNGWHLTNVNFNFYGDKSTKENILEFEIEENQKFKISSYKYSGLETVDSLILQKIETAKFIKDGDNFSEINIITEVNKINDILLNNGYYYSYPKKPDVFLDTTNYTDVIIINFDVGNRYKVGQIIYKDYLNKQNPLAFRFKQKYIDFKEDEWVSQEKIFRTQRNLVNLNLFENVIIDTIVIPENKIIELSNDSNKSRSKVEDINNQNLPNDSLISFLITSKYSKQQDWGIAPFINKTAFDELVNLGLEGSVSHKNWWGAAQNFKFFSNVSIKDINRSINDWLLSEVIYQVGFNYSQPLLWNLDNSKVGFSFTPSFARRSINNLINISSIVLPVRFPISLPSKTYFNQILIDFDFERQLPLDNLVIDTLNNQTAQLRQFVNLKAYTDLAENKYSLTSNIIGITFLGDRRNNPFSPTNGYYTNISFDGWNFILGHSIFEGLSKYYRFQLAHYQFFQSGELNAFAFKGRIGATYVFDFNNNYLPIEKQFFAGGANSVRGWESRRLRYTQLTATDLQSPEVYRVYQDFVGSKTIIEGSFEYRYKFSRPNYRNEFLADMIAKSGFTFFLDFGNSFGWYVEEDKTSVNYFDYITKLAVAAGVGFRFDTPVGPFRVDFALPIQGPIPNKPDFIFNRYNAISDYRIHLGLGHAF